jgi:uroporphyrinogen decarboxylase
MGRRAEAELGRSREDLLDAYDVDLRYLAGPEYVGPPLVGEHGEAVDLWGVPRTVADVVLNGGSEQYEEVTRPPLAGMTAVEEVLEYAHWPSPDWFDYSVIVRQAEAVLYQGRAVAFMGDRLNRIAQLKPAMYLRGVEQILLDMALAPELAEAIYAKIRAFYLGYLERLLDAAGGRIDLLVTGDDFGAQDGLLVSPAMWDRFLRDGFAQYLALARSHGVRTMHHTCGAVRALLPQFIEAGLDVLQSLQPEARGMVAEELKAEFGARLAFQGGLSIQRLLPFGTPQGIRAEVRRLAEVMRPGGGYIFGTSHNLQADTPVANLLALLDAYHEFGRY